MMCERQGSDTVDGSEGGGRISVRAGELHLWMQSVIYNASQEDATVHEWWSERPRAWRPKI